MRRLLPTLLLAACAQPPDPAPPAASAPTAGDPCGADGYASLVGETIAAVTLPADLDHRVIGPDTVVTMDYRPERLNIEVDANGTVLRLRCG